MKRVLAYFIFQKLCKVTKVFFNLQIYGAKNKYKKHTIYIYIYWSAKERQKRGKRINRRRKTRNEKKMNNKETNFNIEKEKNVTLINSEFGKYF